MSDSNWEATTRYGQQLEYEDLRDQIIMLTPDDEAFGDAHERVFARVATGVWSLPESMRYEIDLLRFGVSGL